MKRVRLLLALVAILLAVPLGLLVARALSSAKAEERGRRQALADTAFAAVERELATLLEREEARAWDEWRHLRVPEGEVAGSEGLVRSPLADLPVAPWNLGWFQVEPDGAIGTPLLPDPKLAATLGLEAPSGAARQRDAELRQDVRAWLAARPARPTRPAPAAPPPLEEEEGAERRLGDLFRRRDANEAYQEPAREALSGGAPTASPPELRSSSIPYDAKKAQADLPVEGRRQERAAPRKAEVFQKQATAEAVQQVAARNVMEDKGLAARELSEDADGAAPLDRLERDALTLGASERLGAAEPAVQAEGFARFDDEAPAGRKDSQVDVVVEPFAGELDPAGRLVLHRLVVVAGTTYRQGLVVQVDRLAEAVNPLELLARTAGAGGRFELAAAASPRESGVASFSRRLPPPFDALRAVLRLELAEGLDGTRYVLGLAALVALFGILGLVAVERMVAVALGYAQRRSDFVSAVTHELKTPLAAIRLHGELLSEGIARTEEKRAASYRTITAECERLTRLVDNVLELSRLEKGTRSVSLLAGPIEPVLREAIGILEPHARRAGFSLELEVESGLAARFDRDALLQVVLNLVDNALKYAREASDKRVLLSAFREGDRVALSVRDRGPGVPPRHLRRIFQPFWRGERELTRRAKGTGIGLALVRGLVERMQGSVEGRNAPEGGFEVLVSLPGAGA